MAFARRRRSIPCTAAVLLALLAAPLVGQQPPTSQPATTQPAKPETVSEARARLHQEKKTDRDAALTAALDLVVALGAADGPQAAELIDAVGYQPLPAEGPLPLEPARPIPREQIAALVARRPAVPLEHLPAGSLEILDQKSLRPAFPAAATWMLPQDWAVTAQPLKDRSGWVTRRTCLIVRVRAGKASIVAGDFFAALAEP